MVSITEYGAIGNGIYDCSPAIELALKNEREIFFPNGVYLLTKVLEIPSDRHLCLDKNAILYAADNCFNKPNTLAIITNDDHVNGNRNIVIEGGKIDANNLKNGRIDWLNGPNCGLTFSFKNVKGLTVKNMISHNADSYNFHLCRVEDFLIENIKFTASHLPKCQDGVHVGGFCHRGVIRDISAQYGCTNDDLIAFSADELHEYIHNTGLEDGPISDMLVENVYAENCWSAIRILSVKSEISNLTFRNVKAGVRRHGFIVDCSRYLEHPLFSESEHPNGVGNLKNINIEDVTFWRTDKIWQKVVDNQADLPISVDSFDFGDEIFNVFESLGEMNIKNLQRDVKKDCSPEVPFIRLKNLYNTNVTVNGDSFDMNGELRYLDGDKFDMTIKTL